MTICEALMVVFAVAGLVLTVYFGMRKKHRRKSLSNATAQRQSFGIRYQWEMFSPVMSLYSTGGHRVKR